MLIPAIIKSYLRLKSNFFFLQKPSNQSFPTRFIATWASCSVLREIKGNYFPLVIETKFVIVSHSYWRIGIDVFTQNSVIVAFLFVYLTLKLFSVLPCITSAFRTLLFFSSEIRRINFPLIKSATFIIMSDKNVSSSVYILTYNGYFTIELFIHIVAKLFVCHPVTAITSCASF